MRTVRQVLGWLGGKAILYVLLVVAILASAFVLPRLRAEWNEPTRHLGIAEQLEATKTGLDAERLIAEQRLSAAALEAQGKSLAKLNDEIAEASRAKAVSVTQRRSTTAKAISLATADNKALAQDGQRELDIQFRDRQIAGLSAVRDQLLKRDALAAFPTNVEARLSQTTTAAYQSGIACRSARQTLEAFDARWEVVATFKLYDRARRRQLESAQADRCRESAAADRRQLDAAALKKRKDDAMTSYQLARGWTDSRMQAVTQDLEAKIAEERAAASGSWRQKLSLWAERNQLSAVLWQAGAAMVLIIGTPFLIRLFCYFILAPIAMRRPAIRIVASGAGGIQEAPDAVIVPAEPSSTSVGVRLAAGEELLVRHGYLQTTSDAGGKGTQWFLDARHPITSMATGLTFLTRVRGEGEMTTVSAVRDPFAEVTVMSLPDGSACVLQPRALAAVIQPISRPLRVTSHWRLFSLNAWLTLQLRYLVFHGPVRLVLKGGRGVRVERAERGRVLGQEQVIGFSTDVAYSVTRTETFWPYFLGREALLKDRVAPGDGVLVVEEAPMAGRRAGETPHGIEGMIDAAMKVFGM